ncbi:MAG: DUF1648 domain-containing protein [Armatimonadetes bacterium]|nr:DUF1648 domain-containing protein [Armatimonadota bacterium]
MILFVGSLIAGLMSLLRAGSIPDRVPMHWNLAGQVDRYGSRWEGLLFIPIMSLVLSFVFMLIGAVSGSRLRQNTVKALNIISAAMMTFFLVIHNFMLSAQPDRIPGMIPGGLACLMVVMGFAIKDVEPNPFVGIRVPWTMNNPLVWRKTHDRASRLWIVGGAVALVLALLHAPTILPIAVFVGLILYPMLDSYRISKTG